jgi:cob(I)alamin adenosyltransferase
MKSDQVQFSDKNHKSRQQKLKDHVEQQVASAQVEKGIFQVITGNGKGKSTSGFGVVTRCVGYGKKAAVVQFIKGEWECGERLLLEKAGVAFSVMKTGFTWDTQDREADTLAAQVTWKEALKYLKDETIDVVLLDELTYMVSYKYLDLTEVLDAIESRPKMQSVIVTGRAAHRELIERADTVSEVKNIKHAFDSGVKALQGFDY